MEPKISKSQTEVWEWKEKAFEALKDLPIEAQLAEIHRQTAATVASIRQKQQAKRAKDVSA